MNDRTNKLLQVVRSVAELNRFKILNRTLRENVPLHDADLWVVRGADSGPDEVSVRPRRPRPQDLLALAQECLGVGLLWLAVLGVIVCVLQRRAAQRLSQRTEEPDAAAAAHLTHCNTHTHTIS